MNAILILIIAIKKPLVTIAWGALDAFAILDIQETVLLVQVQKYFHYIRICIFIHTKISLFVKKRK